MRTKLVACLVAGFAVAGAALWDFSLIMRVEPAQIDFTSLRDEATSAMRLLQVAQERRTASLQTEEF